MPAEGVDDVQVPPGFDAVLYFSGLEHPTSMAIGPDGRLYVAQQSGEIVSIADENGDGVGDHRIVYTTGLTIPLGITFVGEDLYVSHRGKVTRTTDENEDGVADTQQDIITGLPVGGELHQNVQNNGIAWGGDGFLYVSIAIGIQEGEHPGDTTGSEAGHSATPSPGSMGRREIDRRSGTIIRIRPDGSEQGVYATGFKNPYGIVFDANGNLFATDQSSHNPEGPAELNHVVVGQNYGYPNRDGGVNQPGTVPVVAKLQTSSSPDGFSFYYGDQFPDEYRGSAFIAQWGSATEDPNIGKRVMRVELERVDGRFQGTKRVFATGFEHPLATVVGPDGSLFVAEWGSLDPEKKGSGAIYRIFYSR